MLKAEAEAKPSRPRSKFWHWGQGWSRNIVSKLKQKDKA